MAIDLEKLKKRATFKNDITDVVMVGITKEELNELLEMIENAELKVEHIRDECEFAMDNERGRCKQFAHHLITCFIDNPEM